MKCKRDANYLNKSHMDSRIIIEGEDFVGTNLDFDGDNPAPSTDDKPPDTEREFCFVRMFDKDKFPIQRYTKEKRGLIELGQAIEKSDVGALGELPAGFTFLGQFIDHDITRDVNADENLLEKDEISVEKLVQGRSPALDLDSLYGSGPERRPELYEADGVRLTIGLTTPTDFGGGITNKKLPNDLPRDIGKKKAIIGDERNDENLVIAQTHLAFIKFHNKIVSTLEPKFTDKTQLFQEARKLVTLHYQSIVLHDFLPRIVDPDVLQDIQRNKPSFFHPKIVDKTVGMPVEFAVAAYRFGHSLVRDAYEWNRFYQTNGEGNIASLDQIFEFSGGSGKLDGQPTLPTSYIIDWSRFYDFSEVTGISNNPQSNQSFLINTKMAVSLKKLPEFVQKQMEKNICDKPHLQSLATRNLLRGRLIGLPSGQQLADAIDPSSKLSRDELKAGPHGDILRKWDLLENTPLWYYILFEAETRNQGRRLGPVGSRIVAETLFVIAKYSQNSILRDNSFTPSLPSLHPDKFTMVDLLKFVDDINPLGN